MDVSFYPNGVPHWQDTDSVMQNASKNAGDMINKFQILFNRTRQAVITGELVEIITGAAASEEG
jgi:F-type H+-transporting ATPase subunit gamma